MVRVIILTESDTGTAAHHFPFLLNQPSFAVVQVVKSSGRKRNRKGLLIKKLKKIRQIGLLGALNGIRMRNWFTNGVDAKLKPLPLSRQCKTAGIPYNEVEYTHGNDTISLFRAAKADIGISLGNGYIGPSVFSIPRYGMINIHHELLPEFKNAQSVIWQLYHLSSSTGYTIHRINNEIDGGDILLKEKVPIVFEKDLPETIAATSEHLLLSSAKGLVSVLSDLPGYIERAEKQGEGRSYTTPSWKQFRQIQKNFQQLSGKK